MKALTTTATLHPRDIGRAWGGMLLPPALAGISFSSSSSFFVAVFLVVVVFVIIPPLPIFLYRDFLIVLLVSLASSTIRAEGTTNVSYRIIIRLFLSRDYLLVFSLHASIVIYCIFITCCFVLINPTVMFPYEAHLFTNNISCFI